MSKKSYFAEIPCATLAWRQRPKVQAPKVNTGAGRPATRPQLASDAPRPQRIDELAQALDARHWRRVIVHEGTT